MRDVQLDPAPLGDLLGRVSLELLSLQRSGQVVEDAIAQSLLGGEVSVRANLANLQGIDAIVQSLGELAKFVDALSHRACVEHHVDVNEPIQSISLRELARNLAGAKREPVLGETGEIIGEVDLF